MNTTRRNLIGLGILVTVWVICWGEAFLHPGSFDAGPSSGWALFGLPFLATIALGFVVPRWAWLGGALMYVPYFAWLPLHLHAYDGSEGATLAGVGLFVFPVVMLFLALVGLIVGYFNGGFQSGTKSRQEPPLNS